VGKLTVAVSGLLAIIVAIVLSRTHGSALSLYYLATSIVAGGLAGLFLLAFLVRRAGRRAALIAITANLVFTAWATLTMNGGHTWNLHLANYPWHEFTIGAVGNTLMFVIGYVVSVVWPADHAAGPTLWDWLSMKRKAKREELGDRDESFAQSR
jgi:SSS family solute:Na+ symporter